MDSKCQGLSPEPLLATVADVNRKEQAEEAFAVVETELQGIHRRRRCRFHQKDFADASITPSGERALRDGALAMAFTIIDMAEQNVCDKLGTSSAE